MVLNEVIDAVRALRVRTGTAANHRPIRVQLCHNPRRFRRSSAWVKARPPPRY